jgi:hypothetical protein
MTDRDLLEQIGKLRFRVLELEGQLVSTRNDTLEEAVEAVEDHSQVGTRCALSMACYSNAANAIRALKNNQVGKE